MSPGWTYASVEIPARSSSCYRQQSSWPGYQQDRWICLPGVLLGLLRGLRRQLRFVHWGRVSHTLSLLSVLHHISASAVLIVIFGHSRLVAPELVVVVDVLRHSCGYFFLVGSARLGNEVKC